MNDISSLDLLAIIELDEKPKIKKYRKIRELHGEVITAMFNHLSRMILTIKNFINN